MSVIDSEQRLIEVLRSVRLSRGMSQAAVAKALSLSQAAVSRVERGHLDAISAGKLAEMAQYFGIEVDLSGILRGIPGSVGSRGYCYCSNALCWSCVPVRLADRVYLMPTPRQIRPECRERFCDLCGEPLVDQCAACGAPASGRIMCPSCGRPLVEVDASMIEEISSQRRIIAGEVSELRKAWLELVAWQRELEQEMHTRRTGVESHDLEHTFTGNPNSSH